MLYRFYFYWFVTIFKFLNCQSRKWAFEVVTILYVKFNSSGLLLSCGNYFRAFYRMDCLKGSVRNFQNIDKHPKNTREQNRWKVVNDTRWIIPFVCQIISLNDFLMLLSKAACKKELHVSLICLSFLVNFRNRTSLVNF